MTPLLVHPAAAISKRLLAPNAPRSLTSVLSLTGYIAVPLLIAHYVVNRSYPTDPIPPIAEVGPSELDYEFVKVFLKTMPWAGWIGYGGLTVTIAWHAIEGLRIVWNVRFREVVGRWTLDAYARAAMASAAALPVLSGLYIMSREPVFAFAGVASRYRAVLAKAWFIPRF